MPNPPTTIPVDLVDRYLTQQCTPEERAWVETWLAADPEHVYVAQALRGALAYTPDVEAALGRFRRGAQWTSTASAVAAVGTRQIKRGFSLSLPSERETAELAGGATVKKLSRRWLRRDPGQHPLFRTVGFGVAAGAVFLAGGLGIGAYVVNRARPTHDGRGRAALSAPMTEVATVHGQRATIHLSDGSRVTLGVASHIRYPRDFGAVTRDLELEGEAYFDVKHDTRVPFRVRTKHGIAEDVGTKFAVRAYPGDAVTRVVVTEGKVGVGSGTVLIAGDVARLMVGVPPVVQHGIPVDRLLSWTTGRIEFADVPLRDVVGDLGRWYDVTVRVDDPVLAQQPVTATFRDAPASAVLEFIARVVGARIEQRDGVHVFVPVMHTSVRRVP